MQKGGLAFGYRTGQVLVGSMFLSKLAIDQELRQNRQPVATAHTSIRSGKPQRTPAQPDRRERYWQSHQQVVRYHELLLDVCV
ncbi:hypothetical protein D3C75_1053450 [compost metagenome]